MGHNNTLLKGGLIGLGRMGITHLAILNSHPNIAMTAACDTSSFVSRQFQRFSRLSVYEDWRQMIEQENLDFVVISTPTSLHAEPVRVAIDHGLHVFVEKPFTLDVADGERLVHAAEQAGLANQVGYVNRFNRVFQEVRRLIESSLGEILYFSCSMHAPTVVREPGESWRNRRDQGGGCLCDFACHGIDLIHYLVGVPDDIGGTSLPSIYSQTEDAVYTTFVYNQGFIGHLRVNWSDESCRKPSYHFEVEATNGRLSADQHGYRLYLKKAPAGTQHLTGWSIRYATDLIGSTRFYLRGNEFTDQLDYFVDRMLGHNNGDTCSFATGLQVDRMMQAIRSDASRIGVA